MDNETFEHLLRLTSITRINILKSIKLYSIKSEEVYDMKLDEIFESMHKALDKITKYLEEKKNTVITEIRELELQKYSFLQEYCKNRNKHLMIDDTVLAEDYFSQEFDLCNQKRCLVCRTNQLNQMTFKARIVDSDKIVIPTSISIKKEFKEIDNKLSKLYSRYQMITQISYNICSLYGHIDNEESYNQCNRCGMWKGPSEKLIYDLHIKTKNQEPLLEFLVCDYDFYNEIVCNIPRLISLSKLKILALLCFNSNIPVNINEQPIIDDDKIDEYYNHREEQKKIRIKKIIDANRRHLSFTK